MSERAVPIYLSMTVNETLTLPLFIVVKECMSKSLCDKFVGIGPDMVPDVEPHIAGHPDLRYGDEYRFGDPIHGEPKYDEIEDEAIEILTEAAVSHNVWGVLLDGRIKRPLVLRYFQNCALLRHVDYRPHEDCPGRLNKLTVVVQLSNSIECSGGQLLIGKEPVPLEKGDAVVFPSYCLHEVTKVESGERWSLVLWLNGPYYR